MAFRLLHPHIGIITCAPFRKRPVTGRSFALPLAPPGDMHMEKKYWIGRKRAAMGMARGASSAEARLIHYDMAGRYSIKAAQCVPYLLARTASSAGEGVALHAPPPGDPCLEGDPK